MYLLYRSWSGRGLVVHKAQTSVCSSYDICNYNILSPTVESEREIFYALCYGRNTGFVYTRKTRTMLAEGTEREPSEPHLAAGRQPALTRSSRHGRARLKTIGMHHLTHVTTRLETRGPGRTSRRPVGQSADHMCRRGGVHIRQWKNRHAAPRTHLLLARKSTHTCVFRSTPCASSSAAVGI